MTEPQPPRAPRPLPPYPTYPAYGQPAAGPTGPGPVGPPAPSPYGPPPQGAPVAPAAWGAAPLPWIRPEPPRHPSAGTALALGILSVAGVLCFIGPVLGPVAWWLGHQAVTEIDRSDGRYSGRSTAEAGRVLGIIGTVMLALGGMFVVLVAGVASTGF